MVTAVRRAVSGWHVGAIPEEAEDGFALRREPEDPAMNLAAILLDLVGQVLGHPLVLAGAMVMAIALTAGWLLATVWAFQDAAHRSESVLARYLAATWVLLSGPVLLPLSLPIYMLLRSPETSADGRLKRLIEALQIRTDEATACGLCGGRLGAQWVRCPRCAAWTGQQCQRCVKWVPAGSDICPWCAWSPGEPLVAPDAPVPVGAAAPARAWNPLPAAPAMPVAAAAVPGAAAAIPGLGADMPGVAASLVIPGAPSLVIPGPPSLVIPGAAKLSTPGVTAAGILSPGTGTSPGLKRGVIAPGASGPADTVPTRPAAVLAGDAAGYPAEAIRPERAPAPGRSWAAMVRSAGHVLPEAEPASHSA
jgi:hypothetical protein